MKKIKNRPSEKNIYLWNIAGSFSNALASVLFLVAVARVTGSKESDIFSLAWSIAQLTLTVGTFQVRLFQATDVEGRFSFHQYLFFRILTVAAQMLVAVFYIFHYHYTGLKAAVILSLCAYKAVEALSDVYQGWFQLKERLDLAGKGMTFRVILSMAVFIITLGVSGNLLLSCLIMTLISIACFILFEIRYMVQSGFQKEASETAKKRQKGIRALGDIFVKCFPLFLNAYLVMLIFNAPKMAIDRAITAGNMEAGMQTVYNIIFMPTTVINLVYLVFRPVVTKMAIEWNTGHSDEYLKLIRKVILGLTFIDIFILAGGYLLGIPVLAAVYGVNLGNTRKALMLLLLAGGLNTLVNVLDNALTVIRKQYTLIIAYVIAWIFAEWSASVMTGQAGIDGAAFSFLSAMGVLLIAVMILFIAGYRNAKKMRVRNTEIGD